MKQGKLTILGCGGSGGTPLAGNKWLDCDPQEPKNRRLRSSVAIQYENKTLQIDTGPDFRQQINTYGITNIEAVIYTHSHADHINGIDELRYLNAFERDTMPIYAAPDTMDELQRRFDYMFRESSDGLYKQVVQPHIMGADMFDRPVTIAGCPVVMTMQDHGRMTSIGFKIGNIGYSTDVSGLSDTALNTLRGVETWIVDCGQYGSDFVYAHPNLDVVMGWNDVVGAQRVILTHLTPRADYRALCDALPQGYEPAYDGMEIEFSYETSIMFS